MIEQIQFWGVLLWMIAMLAFAALAVRAVWRDATRPPDDLEPGTAPKNTADTAEPSDR
jgi:hypothetical protein